MLVSGWCRAGLPAVGYDFSLPSEERVIFDIVDRNMLPGDMVTKDIVLPGQIAKDMDAWIRP